MSNFISGRCFLLLETNLIFILQKNEQKQNIVMIDLVYTQCIHMHKTALVLCKFGLQNTFHNHVKQVFFQNSFCTSFTMGKALLALENAPFLSFGFHPMKCFSRVFPFKVLFHVQNAMHAIAKYCSSVE